MPGRPHPQGRIVELAAFPSRFEADVVVAMLASNGIKATANYGDSDGWAPHLALYHGAQVLVFDEDLDSARALLVSASPLEEPTDN